MKSRLKYFGSLKKITQFCSIQLISITKQSFLNQNKKENKYAIHLFSLLVPHPIFLIDEHKTTASPKARNLPSIPLF